MLYPIAYVMGVSKQSHFVPRDIRLHTVYTVGPHTVYTWRVAVAAMYQMQINRYRRHKIGISV